MSRPRHLFRRFIAPLLVVLAFLAAMLFTIAWLPLRDARDAWKHGRDAEGIARAERWSRLRLWPSQYHQFLAAAYLTSGNASAARTHLDALRGCELWLPAVKKTDVARRLFAAQRYADFLDYDAATHERSETREIKLYRAAAMQRRSGTYPLIVDRNGAAIANYQLASHDIVTIDPHFATIVDKSAGALTFGAHLPELGATDTVETTLNAKIQNAAIAALASYRGAIVAIDPRTNEILAIASTAGKGAPSNLALEQQYEPGSVVKVLTGLNAIASGVDMKSLFPYDCRGALTIDGRRFGDWVPQGHGPLPSLDEALAQSCNIVFADIGLRLGEAKLRDFMARAGFDGQTNLGVFQAPLGKIVPPIAGNYDTASLAIGLDHETMNALHVAMLASMMANRGMLTQPRLLRGRRSVLGELTSGPPPQGSARLAPAAAAEEMVRAMIAVATSAKGTGRRAAVEGMTLAMKTGTAGSRKDGGLEAIILAFAPVEHPKIAFGIIAEDAGPAEFAGAEIAHDFLVGCHPERSEGPGRTDGTTLPRPPIQVPRSRSE